MSSLKNHARTEAHPVMSPPAADAQAAMELWRAGALDDAQDLAAQAFIAIHGLPGDRAELVIPPVALHLAMETGAPEEQIQDLEATCEHTPPGAENGTRDLLVAWATARRHLAQREVERAVAVFEAPGSEPDTETRMAVALWVARQATRYSEPSLRALARRLVESVHKNTPLFEIAAREVAAHTGSRSEAVKELHSVAAAWHRAGRPLDAARTLMSAGVLELSTGDQHHARLSLVRAQAELRQCGARGDVAVIARLLENGSTSTQPTQEALELLAGLSSAQYENVLASSLQIQLSAGKGLPLVVQDDGATCVIMSGRLHANVTARDGQQVAAALLDPGDLVPNAPGDKPLELVAATDVTLLFWSGATIAELKQRIPALARVLANELHDTSSRFARRAADLAGASAEQRVWLQLRYLDERYGRPTLDGQRVLGCRLSVEELAAMVGASQHATQRALSQLDDDGLISLHGERIVVETDVSARGEAAVHAA